MSLPGDTLDEISGAIRWCRYELIHWTSNPERCNRQLGKRFGDDAYAFEELIAELGSAFTAARLGLTNTPRADHVNYLAH